MYGNLMKNKWTINNFQKFEDKKEMIEELIKMKPFHEFISHDRMIT